MEVIGHLYGVFMIPQEHQILRGPAIFEREKVEVREEEKEQERVEAWGGGRDRKG